MKDIQKKTKYPFLLLFASIWLCFIPVFRSKDTEETQDTKKTFAVEESKMILHTLMKYGILMLMA